MSTNVMLKMTDYQGHNKRWNTTIHLYECNYTKCPRTPIPSVINGVDLLDVLRKAELYRLSNGEPPLVSFCHRCLPELAAEWNATALSLMVLR